MKLITVFITFIIMITGLVSGCTASSDSGKPAPDISGENSSGSNSSAESLSDETGNITADSSVALVVYYSYSGNTKRIALRLAELTGADVFEIETVKSYPSDPYETADISREERSGGNLPELKATPDIAPYSTIFIAGPIWNAYMSTPLEKYLELTDFFGKKLVPISTSMGSGQTGYLKDFKNRAKNAAEIAEYLDVEFPGNGQPNAFSDAQIDEKLKPWLEKIDYNKSENSEVQTMNNERKALLTLDGKEYEVNFSDNPTAKDVYAMLPLSLTLTPYSNLEYSARLPETPVYDGSPTTASAKCGTINYCKEYNSFVVICQDHADPFQEVVIADIIGDISWLTSAGSSVKAEIKPKQ